RHADRDCRCRWRAIRAADASGAADSMASCTAVNSGPHPRPAAPAGQVDPKKSPRRVPVDCTPRRRLEYHPLGSKTKPADRSPRRSIEVYIMNLNGRPKKDPNKRSIQLSLRLDPELVKTLRAAAEKEDRSLSREIERRLRYSLVQL